MLKRLESDDVTRERLARIGEHIQRRLSGRVRDFLISLRDRAVVLQGSAQSHHAGQLAQQAVMVAVSLPIRANEIEVYRAG